MDKARVRIGTRWLAGILVILLLTAFGSQSTYTQDWSEQHPLGDIPLDPATYQKHLKVWPADMADGLPSAYDARTEGIVTFAKNQGSCGSCWAFASVGAMESHIQKKYQSGLTDLSEQQQVSCNTAMAGCDGGSSTAIRYWESKGPLYESCFSYTASDTTPCAEAGCEQLGYRVIDWHTVGATPTDFKNSLYTYGPSYWRYDVYTDFDTYWAGGSAGQVYVNQLSSSFRGGHAVLLIGWDDAKGAYLCKNSWGGGGLNGDGTFWIAYSGHAHNLGFGMANFSLTAVGCASDADCNDGLYCNGIETCVNRSCQAGTPPTCPDDERFCTGSEVCDEASDACGHTGDPCGPGTVCNETSDSCVLPNCGNRTCDQGESCTNCPSDCIGGQSGTCPACFKGKCDGICNPAKEGPTCADCGSYCCGDGVCGGAEDRCSCALDCGAPLSSEAGYCTNGIDDDCDLTIDCLDSQCVGTPACNCLAKGSACSSNSQCCSLKCRTEVCR